MKPYFRSYTNSTLLEKAMWPEINQRRRQRRIIMIDNIISYLWIAVILWAIIGPAIGYFLGYNNNK